MALVSLQQAKAHLRISDENTDDDDIHLKLEQASAIVLDYLKAQADPSWTEAMVPGNVQAAILLWVTHLYEQRGDDMQTDVVMWDATRRLLERLRDPALA